MKVENVNKSENNTDNFNRTALDDGQAKEQQSNNRGNTLPNNVEDIVDITGNSDLLKILETDINRLSDGSSKKDVLFYNSKTNIYSDDENVAEDKDAVQDPNDVNLDESNNKTEVRNYTNVKERMLIGKNEYNKTASNSTNLTSLGLRREYGTPNRLNSFINSDFNASKNPFYSGRINNTAVFRGDNEPIGEVNLPIEGAAEKILNNGDESVFENSRQIGEEILTSDGARSVVKGDVTHRTENLNGSDDSTNNIKVDTPNETTKSFSSVINNHNEGNSEKLSNSGKLDIDGFKSDGNTELKAVEDLTGTEFSDKSSDGSTNARVDLRNSNLDLNVKVQDENVKTVSEQKVNSYETKENMKSPVDYKGSEAFKSANHSKNIEKDFSFNIEKSGYTNSVRKSTTGRYERLKNDDNSVVRNSQSFVNKQSRNLVGARNGGVKSIRNYSYGYESDLGFGKASLSSRDKRGLNISEKRLEIEKRNINSNEYLAAQTAYQAIAQRNINDVYRGFSELDKLIAVLFRLRKLTVKKAGKVLKEIYDSRDEEDEAKLLLNEAKSLIEREGYKRGRVINLLNKFLDDQEKIKYCVGLSPFPIAAQNFNNFFDSVKDEAEDIKSGEEKARREEIMKSVIRVFALALLVIVFYIIFMR